MMEAVCISSHAQWAKGIFAPKAVERESRERDLTEIFIETRHIADWRRRPAEFLLCAAD